MSLQHDKVAGASCLCEERGKNAALYLPGGTQDTAGAECGQHHGSGWPGAPKSGPLIGKKTNPMLPVAGGSPEKLA